MKLTDFFILLVLSSIILGILDKSIISIIPIVTVSVLVIFLEKLDSIKAMYFGNALGPTVFLALSLAGMSIIHLIAYSIGYLIMYLEIL